MNILKDIKVYNRYLSFADFIKFRIIKNKKTANFLNKKIKITDYFWFKHSISEIFIEEVYKFHTAEAEPLIIDCGSNIGLSIIYFKLVHPNAKIIGFEPDLQIFEKLKSNIEVFALNNVTILRAAVWDKHEKLNFQGNRGLGGRIVESQKESDFIVNGLRLRDYLDKKVAFLKLDIEGAELEILKDCADKLINVEFIFIEYHSFLNQKQTLSEILKILSFAGFRYYIKEAWVNMEHPFIDRHGKFFDLQLNIFGYRI